MRTTGQVGGVLAVLACATLAGAQNSERAQGERTQGQQGTRVSELEQRLDALQQEVRALRAQRQAEAAKTPAIGSAGSVAPSRIDSDYTELAERAPLQGDAVTSRANEKIKIGGRLDFEFYDRNASRANLGNYGGSQFGLDGGGTAFRIRRLQLELGMELIEDFRFHSTLTLDPVVRDEDEGAVDIDEAYVRFSNIVRNLANFEDPSHTFIQVGNYYRWERDMLERVSESFSLAGTAFYRDEVTGIMVGGDFEEGPFWRVSLDNGSALAARDAGVGAFRGAAGAAGNSPMFHDNEQLGDANNSKDFAIGGGYRAEFEEPKLQVAIGASYRAARLSAAEQAFLAGVSPGHFGRNKQRFGILANAEMDVDAIVVGANAEVWFAKDGNGDREAWSLGPYVRLPLDGVYYQQRLFFTSVGAAYRWSALHQSNGLRNGPTLATAILDDRNMHTVDVWLEITRNVDLRLELNNIDPGRSKTETEWLIQWSVRF